MGLLGLPQEMALNPEKWNGSKEQDETKPSPPASPEPRASICAITDGIAGIRRIQGIFLHVSSGPSQLGGLSVSHSSVYRKPPQTSPSVTGREAVYVRQLRCQELPLLTLLFSLTDAFFYRPRRHKSDMPVMTLALCRDHERRNNQQMTQHFAMHFAPTLIRLR